MSDYRYFCISWLISFCSVYQSFNFMLRMSLGRPLTAHHILTMHGSGLPYALTTAN